MENVNGNGNRRPGRQPQNPRPPPNFPPPSCPRCESIYTKFCYYNNYSPNQPRYLCKTCKRHWTHGGSLRNVPIGGGTRKGSKTSKTASGAAASSSSGGEISLWRGDQRAPLTVPLQLPLSLQGNTGSLLNQAKSFITHTDILSCLAASMPSRPQIYNYNHLIFTGVGAQSTNLLLGNSAQSSGGVGGSGGAGTSRLAVQSFGRNQNYERQPLVNANLLPFYQPQQRQQSESERGYQLSGSDQRMVMIPQLSNGRQNIVIQNNPPNTNNSNSGLNNGGTGLSWAQARMAVQQQNRESAGTSRAEPPVSMVIQNQWSDDDDEEVNGYGPPSPSSAM